MFKNEYEIPTSRKMRDEIWRANQQGLVEQTEKEKRARGRYTWTIYDSPLLKNKGDTSFEAEFGVFCDENMDLRTHIETILENEKGNAIGIEFGGPGSNLFADFSDGFFKRTLGVALVDKRGPIKKRRDKVRQHSVIPGDLQASETVQCIDKWVGGQGCNLIIERMGGGTVHIVTDPYVLGEHFAHWYSLLGEHALMLLQVPTVMRPLVNPWTQLINNSYADVLQVKTAGSGIFGCIQVIKLPGAPETLPLLSPLQTRRAYQSYPFSHHSKF